MSLGSGKQKALLGAGLRSAPEPAGTGREIWRAALPRRVWGRGRAGVWRGLACCLAAGAFPPTSLGITLAGVHSPHAIARLP